MMNEIWRPIKGYEGLYEVSNLGRVKSLERVRPNMANGLYKERILKGQINRGGYHKVALLRNEGKSKLCSVHRLVAEAFISNPNNKPCIDHINTIKTDNSVENLRWVTWKENVNNPLTLAYKSEISRGGKNAMAKTIVSVDCYTGEVKFYGSSTESLCELGIKDTRYIRLCCMGKMKSYKGRQWFEKENYNKLKI